MSIVHVQGNSSLNSSSVTITAVASGDTIVGMATYASQDAPILTITDDKGNSYTPKDTITDASLTQAFTTFILGNITNGPSTISFTTTANNHPSSKYIIVDEYSGTATTSDPSDGHTAQLQSGAPTGTNGITSGSITPTTNGDLIWGVTQDALTNNTSSSGTGFTSRTTRSDPGNTYFGTEDLIQSTAASVAATFTNASGDDAMTGVIAIKAAGGAAAIATLGVGQGTIFVPGGRARGPARGLSALRAFADPIIPIAPAVQVGMAQGFLFKPGRGPMWDVKRRQAFPSSNGSVFSDSVAETGIAVDTPSASAIFAASDTEAGTATDTSSGLWVTSSTITEAGTAVESESVTASFASSITEANSAADSYVATAVFVASETEAGSASDSPSTTAIFAASDTEAASAADSESSTGAVISDGVIEAATAAETETAIVTFAAAASEVGSATDASSNTAIFSAATSEAGNAIDTEDANGVFVASDTEAATATDLSIGIIPGPPSTDGPHSNPFFATPGPMTAIP